jgi:hypothetical protein
MIVGEDAGDFWNNLAKSLRVMLCCNDRDIEDIGDFQGKYGGVPHSLGAIYFG